MAISLLCVHHCTVTSLHVVAKSSQTNRQSAVSARSIQKKNLEMRKQKAMEILSDTGIYQTAMDSLPPEGFAVLMSCVVGIFTGIGVVAFNYAVHEIHDIVWDGVPRITWLRAQPLSSTWEKIIIVPVGGGIVVGMLNTLQGLAEPFKGSRPTLGNYAKSATSQVLKTTAAAVTLGTGNSLGPEGPSVEIGSSIAKGMGAVFRNSRERRTSLVAAGSAAGISSGFNAAVAGCFFAVETVLRSGPSSSLSTAMVLLSSVLASVVSQAGLGADPAFKVAAYDFRSPAELPLYLLLGVLCGGVSISLTKGSALATSLFDKFQKSTGIPAGFLPSVGGVCVAIISLAYPEVLYWGFENVDAILESRPWARGPPADLLIQLVGAKLVATSICRGSRLVGGVYAPSLFIGAALGSAYGKFAGQMISHASPIYHLDALQVAAPQAYALVGMAATLAGVCQVPFTSVLLLFELTRDYRIILPLMAAVGLSSWIASSYGVTDQKYTTKLNVRAASAGGTEYAGQSSTESRLVKELLVSSATRNEYLSVSPDAEVEEAVRLFVEQKQWCILVIGEHSQLEGILTLGDIQHAAKTLSTLEVSRIKVSSICKRDTITASPDMSIERAQLMMSIRGLRQLPVVSKSKRVLGIVDNESIKLACRAEATKRMLQL